MLPKSHNTVLHMCNNGCLVVLQAPVMLYVCFLLCWLSEEFRYPWIFVIDVQCDVSTCSCSFFVVLVS